MADETGKAERKPPPWLDPMNLEGRFADLAAASGKMMGAWTEAWSATLTGRGIPAMNLMNPATWTKEGGGLAALEAALGTPQWSDMASLDTATLERFAPAVELTRLGGDYAAAVGGVFAEICRTYQARLAAAGLTLDGSGEALDLWNTTVDETLMAFNRSDAFADLQRRFVRALMAYRLQQRWLVGRLAAQFDLPTREEIDELARRVHDLERENRALRRSLRKPPPAATEPGEERTAP